MKTKNLIDVPFLATAAALPSTPRADKPRSTGQPPVPASDSPASGSVQDLIAKIKSQDDAVRGAAWQNAGKFGPSAVRPLAEVLNDPDLETARAANRALWKIVPSAGRQQKAVAHELALLLTPSNTNTRREVLWMLSEIGDDETVPAVAAFLFNPELREDARAALQRIPGPISLAALKSALAKAPQDYQPALAVSLRARGAEVTGYPSQKLVPTKKTEVKPVATA